MRVSSSFAAGLGGLISQCLAAAAAKDMGSSNGLTSSPSTYNDNPISEFPVCQLEATKTVYVTLPPFSSGSVPIVSHTGLQTTTVMISPVQSTARAQASAQPTTTITIDWSVATDSRIVASNEASQSTKIAETAISGSSLAPYQSTAGISVSSLHHFTVVTDTDVQSLPVPTGSAKFTVLSTHTVTVAIHTTTTAITEGQSALTTASVAPATEYHTYTVIGPGGQQTVIESVSPAVTTTCTSFMVIGQDGIPTVSEVTIVVPIDTQSPVNTGIVVPSFAEPPILSDLEQTIPPLPTYSIITSIVSNAIGSEKFVSPIIQTASAGVGMTVTGIRSNPVIATGVNVPLPSETASSMFSVTITESLHQYGIPSDYPLTPPLSSRVSGIGAPPPVAYIPPPGTTVGPVNEPPAYVFPSPIPFSPYGTDAAGITPGSSPAGYMTYATDGNWPSSILYEPLPTVASPGYPVESPRTMTSLETQTWTNIIPEQTTTYTMKFPLTTMVTITIPPVQPFGKRRMRRQNSADPFSWTNSTTISTVTLTENTSLIARLSSGLVGQTPLPTLTPPSPTLPTTPGNTTPISTPSNDPSLCPSGGKIGNTTINFDDLSRGPLLNPTGDFWFSEGFLIAPPLSPPSNPFFPSSGGQLVEFIPPALYPVPPTDGSGDTAEIGVGPNAAKSCFRFNFYGANLGCAAEGIEQWCEFEFSAYAYNETSATEMPLAWSEVKRVPACPNFPHGSCPLFPVQLDGYTNLSSLLIKLRVGIELRPWWGDDFKVGWADNSCDASACRSSSTPSKKKREVFDRAARRDVWQWTPTVLKKLDNDYVWASFD